MVRMAILIFQSCVIKYICNEKSEEVGAKVMRNSNAKMPIHTCVWVKGEEQKNQTVLFVKQELIETEEKIKLCIACADYYKLIINGETEAWGPSRTAKGYAVADTWEIPFKKGKHTIAVLVSYYGAACYSNVKQPPFFSLQATVNGKNITQDDFVCVKWKSRIQKTQRYSFQRGFAEMYTFDRSPEKIIEDALLSGKREETVAVSSPQILPPFFALSRPTETVSGAKTCGGTFTYNANLPDWHDRSVYLVGNNFEGFYKEELHECMTEKVCRFDYTEVPCRKQDDVLRGGEYAVYDLGANKSGFLQTKLLVKERGAVYVCFDEMLSPKTGNTVDPVRLDCCNIVKYELEVGEYDLETQDVYTAKYMQINVESGAIVVINAGMRLLENRDCYKFRCDIADEDLRKIVIAAQNTLAQNAYDILTDCPSRERAGWLNDQYYSRQAAELFTGSAAICEASLSAILLYDGDAAVPEGFFPMCYPSEHIDGQHIPNCSLWFLLNACDSVRCGGLRKYRERLKEKAYGVLKALSAYENADGLLEDVDGWIFIEWSDARKYTKGINFPLNMLYRKTLIAISEAYQDEKLRKKAEQLGKKIEKLSYNGEFFEDHRMRDESGESMLCGHISEVCQYYAFFSGIANKEKYPVLYDTLIERFGVFRDEKTCYPNVAKANIITGMLMRLDILNEYGEYERVLHECKEMFGGMAARTDTLWEHLRPTASCDHAISSYAAVAIIRALNGIKR